MTPDFTLIWPLSCLKDGVHLSDLDSTLTTCPKIGVHLCRSKTNQGGGDQRCALPEERRGARRPRIAHRQRPGASRPQG